MRTKSSEKQDHSYFLPCLSKLRSQCQIQRNKSLISSLLGNLLCGQTFAFRSCWGSNWDISSSTLSHCFLNGFLRIPHPGRLAGPQPLQSQQHVFLLWETGRPSDSGDLPRFFQFKFLQTGLNFAKAVAVPGSTSALEDALYEG